MKIEEPGTASQEKQRISIDELSNDELSELSDEEMLQIAGGFFDNAFKCF